MRSLRPLGPGRGWFAVAVALAASPLARGGEIEVPAVARLLPERTLALAVMENVSGTLDGLKETSLRRLWADPEFRAFAEPMQEHLGSLFEDVAAEAQMALADVLPLLQGQIAVALLKPPRAGGMPDVIPELAGMCEVADRAAAERVLDAIAGEVAKSGAGRCRAWTEGGVRLMNVPMKDAPFEGHIALADGRLFATVSPDAELVRAMLAASKADAEDGRLSGDADFLKAVERAGERRDLFVYVSVARVAEALFELARMNAPPEEFMKASLVFEALGLDGVRSVSLSARIDPPGIRTGIFVHAPAPRRGLFTLVSDEPIASRTLRTAPEDARGLLAWSLRPDRVPELAREIATAVGPEEAARAEGPIAALEQQLAVTGDFASEGLLFAERASVEPVVELSNVVLALRTGRREGVEPLYRLLGGIVSAEVIKHGYVVNEEMTPEGVILKSADLPLGFSPTVALSDDHVVAAPTRRAALRAIESLSARVGPGADEPPPLVATPDCRGAVARVGEPTFLFAYRRAWRVEDYAPMMAIAPAVAGVAYGVALKFRARPEVVEFLGKINIPDMPSPALLARYSAPSVVSGRTDEEGLSLTAWGPGPYPGGLSVSGSGALVVVAAFAVAVFPDAIGVR